MDREARAPLQEGGELVRAGVVQPRPSTHEEEGRGRDDEEADRPREARRSATPGPCRGQELPLGDVAQDHGAHQHVAANQEDGQLVEALEERRGQEGDEEAARGAAEGDDEEEERQVLGSRARA